MGYALELPGLRATQFSEPPISRAVIPAANGRFSARGLANLYGNWCANASTEWVDSAYRTKVGKVRVRGADHVLKIPMGWRAGFHGIMSSRGPVRGAFGHLGLGGSGGWVHPQREIAVGFVTNGLESSLWGLRIAKINAAIMRCVAR